MPNNIPNDEVPEPVGGGGKGDTLSTDREREDLADNDPSSGTPGGGETGDVDAHKNDEASRGGLGTLLRGTNDSDDELAHQHDGGTPDEDSATAETLNHPEGSRGGDNVDEVGDEGDQEGVINTNGLEEGGTVVEDEATQFSQYRFRIEIVEGVTDLIPVHCWNIWRKTPMRTRRRFPLRPAPLKQSTHPALLMLASNS